MNSMAARVVKPIKPDLADGVTIAGTANDSIGQVVIKEGFRGWVSMSRYPTKGTDKQGKTVYKARVFRVFFTKDTGNRTTVYTTRP